LIAHLEWSKEKHPEKTYGEILADHYRFMNEWVLQTTKDAFKEIGGWRNKTEALREKVMEWEAWHRSNFR